MAPQFGWFYSSRIEAFATGSRESNPEAAAIVRKLGLQPHPEGGYYREIHKSGLAVVPADPASGRPPRPASTAIYFLLTGRNFSAFHRIASEEGWHFYAGTTAVWIECLSPGGEYQRRCLGAALGSEGEPFLVVPAGEWFGARCARDEPDAWALVGCTVAPGFDFADFELASRKELLARFPDHEDLILTLTRDDADG